MTTVPITFAGVDSGIGRTTMMGQPTTTVDSSYLFKLFGEPDPTYQNVPKHIQNVTMETIYNLYANREVKFLSIKLTEMITLRNGSWILTLLAPIRVSTEQNFRMFRNLVNIVPHQPVPPGGIPRMFTTTRQTWMVSKVSNALMAGIDVRVLLDPENGPAAMGDILYGLSVSVLFTLQQQTIIEAVRRSHERGIRNSRGNSKAYLDPQRQLSWEAQYFAIAAKDPSQFLYQIQQFARTVAMTPNMIILWQGGRSRLQANSLTTAVKLNAWVESQDPFTKQIFRQQLPIQNGEQIITGENGIAYVEVPDLRLKESDPEFNVLQTNSTIAQYYVEQAAEHTKDSVKLGNTDVGIYDLPRDNLIKMNVENAINYAGIYADSDPDTSFGDKADDIAKRYTQELHNYINFKNASRVQPRGHNQPDRKQLDGLSKRHDAGFFEFDNPAKGSGSTRDQFIMASWDPVEAQFFIPEYIGSIERRFLPQGWVDHQANDIMVALEKLCERNSYVLSVLTELKEIFMHIDNRDYSYQWFEAILKENYQRYYRYLPARDSVVMVAETTPTSRTNVYGGSTLLEFAPNEWGGLDLPSDFEGIPPSTILAGFANGPGLRTIAAEATKVNSRYKDIGAKVNNTLKSFDTLMNILNGILRGSDFINPALASPWFHKDDVLTVVIENLLASRPPAFLHVPPPAGEGVSTVSKDIFDQRQRPESASSPKFTSIVFPIEDIDAFYAGALTREQAPDASGVKIDALGLSPNLAGVNTISSIHRIVSLLGPAAAHIYAKMVRSGETKENINRVLTTVLAAENFDFNSMKDSEADPQVAEAKAYLAQQKDQTFKNRLTQFAVLQFLANKPAYALASLAVIQQKPAKTKQDTEKNIKVFAANVGDLIVKNARDANKTYKFYNQAPMTLTESINAAPLATIAAQRLVILKSLHGDATTSSADIESADRVEDAYSKAYDALDVFLSNPDNLEGRAALDDTARAAAISSLLKGSDAVNVSEAGDNVAPLSSNNVKRVTNIIKNYKDALTAEGYTFEDVSDTGTVDINRPRTEPRSGVVVPDLSEAAFASGLYVRTPLTIPGKLASQIFATISSPKSRPIVLPGNKDRFYDEPLKSEPTQSFQKAPEFAPISVISTEINTDLQALPLARSIAARNNYWENVDNVPQKQPQQSPRFLSTQTKASSSNGMFDFDIESTSASFGNNGRTPFKSTSAARGYDDWLGGGTESSGTSTNPASSNVFQRPSATRALRGPWKDRLVDMNNSRAKNILQEFLRFAILFTPNKLQSIQSLAQHGITLPFDVIFWRLGMSYRMNNMLLARSNSMILQLSPAHIRTITDNMRGEVYFQNWIDYVPFVVDELGLVFVPNVCPAGYNGGVNTAYITSPVDDMKKPHAAQPSVIVTVHPLTEKLDGLVHFSNTSIFEGIANSYSGTQTQHLWSGADYYAKFVYQEYVRWAKQDDDIRNAVTKLTDMASEKARSQHIEGLYLESQVSLLAFPGPHIGMASNGSFTKLVQGAGPAGELVANWPGAKKIWMGIPGQFPQPNIQHIMGYL